MENLQTFKQNRALKISGRIEKINPYYQFKRLAIRKTATVPRHLSRENPGHYDMPYEELYFQSLDKLTLQGWYIAAKANKATIIVAHGYRRSKATYLLMANWFWKAGYNVFMFDFRSHGFSEGERGTSVGYMERLDLHGAVNYLVAKGEQRIGVIGVSMGASATILATAENPHIKAVVLDSPYAHLYRSITMQVSKLFRMPRIVAKGLGKAVYKTVAQHHGFDHNLAHPANYIHLIAPRPLFLMHGEADHLTELENSLMLYILAEEPKQIWTVPELDHVQIYRVRPNEYRQRVLEFFNKVEW
jgi:uncharacterized protein